MVQKEVTIAKLPGEAQSDLMVSWTSLKCGSNNDEPIYVSLGTGRSNQYWLGKYMT